MISKTKTISRTVRYGQGVERPCHFVGKLFLAAKEDNYALTIDDIVDALVSSKHEAHARRVSTLIWNLESDPNHGGSVFERYYDGREVIGYRLVTPERMNEYGQNVVNTKQIRAHMRALLAETTPKAALGRASVTIIEGDRPGETFSLGNTSAAEHDSIILQDAAELLEDDAKAKAKEESYWAMERKIMTPVPVEPTSSLLDQNGNPVRAKRVAKKVALIQAA